MCGGGDDASDARDDARAEEAARERKMAQSSRLINELFGIHEPNNFNAAGEFVAQPNEVYQERYDTGRRGRGGPIYAYRTATRPGAQEGPYGRTEYLGADPAASQRAYENYQKREKTYGDTRGNLMSFFTQGLDEQLRDTTEQQTYDLARRGLLGGSEQFQAEGDRTSRYDDSLLNLTNEADSQISGLRATDETARLNLLNSIRAGLDQQSAISSATNQLRTNADQTYNAGRATQFSNLFSDLENIYSLNNERKGQQQGVNSQKKYSIGNPSSGYSPNPYNP